MTGVGLVSDLPLVGNALHFAVTLQGLPAAGEQQMTVRPADPGYFRTLRVPLIEGRAFAETDSARAPLVAALNRAAADRLDAAARPGGQLRIAGEPPRTIVGIVGDIRHEGLHSDEGPVVYVPYSQKTFDFVNWMGVVLRGPGVERLGGEIRHVVARIDPDQPVQDIRTLNSYLEDERAPLELSALVIGALAVSSALLALAGIYAMTAFVVGRRTREMGVRIALGASKGSILRLVLVRAGLSDRQRNLSGHCRRPRVRGDAAHARRLTRGTGGGYGAHLRRAARCLCARRRAAPRAPRDAGRPEDVTRKLASALTSHFGSLPPLTGERLGPPLRQHERRQLFAELGAVGRTTGRVLVEAREQQPVERVGHRL